MSGKNKKMKRKPWCTGWLAICFLIWLIPFFVKAETEVNTGETDALNLSAQSGILIEAETGKVIYEKNADEARPPASVTKVMTLLLIFEELEEGRLKKEDIITVSEHAASMGGSQVFLEAGEQQTVETMMKCIAVSSANDACVAVAEHISGSEENFVARMNEKAQELNMDGAHFVNCCGLDADGHVLSARDIAVMSKELTQRYPDIFHYTTIWMDEITHKTRTGESRFGLSNTNKLLKTYPGCNGLKTGSTSKAKFCLSASATKNDVSLIAVVMGCPDSKSRLSDVTKMLDYGFANVHIFEDNDPLDGMISADVLNGEKKKVSIECKDSFRCILRKEENQEGIVKNIHITDPLMAPLQEEEIIGEVEYQRNGESIGTVPIYTKEKIEKKTFWFSLKKIWRNLALDT